MTRPSRNWIAYLCENLASSGMMPTWEAATYLTDNLFGDKPNPRLLRTTCPYEDTTHLLQRLYQPLVAAATRDLPLPAAAMIHVFTDISLTGNSAVLVVYFPGANQPHQLLLLDAAKAWELVFENSDEFNTWAEKRYHSIKAALANLSTGVPASPILPAPLEAVKN
ncbi:MAG: hypothetical protein LZF60_80181 [Nitrospira sp.]|nr:hypothetical protein [Nitrospira sp.]ULA58788.1 MAG: hypothetical protein LZF60_80181 [Nitrospira sp.]